MVLTAEQALKQLLSRVEPHNIGVDVANKHKYLRAQVKNGFQIDDDFLIGSYARATQIRPRTDVDVFFVLNPMYIQQGWVTPRRVYHELLKKLRVTYSKSKLRPDGQAITISQGLFNLDVVPAYAKPDGDYLIPLRASDSKKDWVDCNPKEYAEYLTTLNAQLGGRLVPTIKLFKVWRRHHQLDHISSFHIEKLVSQSFVQSSPEEIAIATKSFSHMFSHVLQRMTRLIYINLKDEVGNQVAPLSSPQQRMTGIVIANSLHQVMRAMNIEYSTSDFGLHVCWRKVLGKPYTGSAA